MSESSADNGRRRCCSGITSSRPSENTSADQEKNGTRRIVIPGARVVKTVVASVPAAANRGDAAADATALEDCPHTGWVEGVRRVSQAHFPEDVP